MPRTTSPTSPSSSSFLSHPVSLFFLLISLYTSHSLLLPQTYRLYNLELPPSTPPTPPNLLKKSIQILKSNSNKRNPTIPQDSIDVTLVRRSFDSRRKTLRTSGPIFNHVVDVCLSSQCSQILGEIKTINGKIERLLPSPSLPPSTPTLSFKKKPTIIITGSGPSGLFSALLLSRTKLFKIILLERGQPVESRGKDIGKLIHRNQINPESNFAYGEGGAGTWSDGKLTTRIGRNSKSVRFVLSCFVKFGAPEWILTSGSPHLGTDNLVKILREMRKEIRSLGGEIRFGAKVTSLGYPENGIVKKVKVEYSDVIERGLGKEETERINRMARERVGIGSEDIACDALILATGHSARDVYKMLHKEKIPLKPKPFAVGFRIEHPQSLINSLQYNEYSDQVVTGKKGTDLANGSKDIVEGILPVASYRLATDLGYDGKINRPVYSFCMCPGGQIVPASTSEEETVVNGMSFSKRDSEFANSAVVVGVGEEGDEVLEEYWEKWGVLGGMYFQEDIERKSRELGGSKFTVPVQRLPNFLNSTLSPTLPKSSYRLPKKSSPLHTVYPPQITNSLKHAITEIFERQIPGYLDESALLHGVETRTSSPIRIPRDKETYLVEGFENFYVAGEGAGYAGGIVSASCDGIGVAEKVCANMGAEGFEGFGLGGKGVKENY